MYNEEKNCILASRRSLRLSSAPTGHTHWPPPPRPTENHLILRSGWREQQKKTGLASSRVWFLPGIDYRLRRIWGSGALRSGGLSQFPVGIEQLVCVCMWGAKFHPTPHHPPSTYIHSAAQRSELLTKGFVARMGDGEVRTYNAKEEKRAWSIDDKHSGRGIS